MKRDKKRQWRRALNDYDVEVRWHVWLVWGRYRGEARPRRPRR